MVRRSTPRKRSTRRSSDPRPAGAAGFSIAEVLVALTLVVVLTGSALAIALSSRSVYDTDLNRTTLNQNLRVGVDLLGIDVRQAGQQLPNDIPAIQILDRAGGGTDTLILQRNELGVVLPVCKDVQAGTASDAVFVALRRRNPPLGCSPVPDGDADDWPDNLQVWRNYRINHGGEVRAYIYNPTTGEGEFFVYDQEDNSTFHIHKRNDDRWQFDYPVDDGSRVYILEEKTYQVTEDILEFYLNGVTDDVRKLIYSVSDFQATAHLDDGSIRAAFGAGDDWSDIESIEIGLSGRVRFRGRTMNRTLTTRFFPRNVHSL